MTQETTAAGPSALPTTLLILRLTLGVFLLQWAIEKLFFTNVSIAVSKVFYFGIVPDSAWKIVGLLQVLLALAIVAGFQQRWSYLLGFIVHGISTVSSWDRLIHPWASQMITMQARGPDAFPYPFNHLFMTGVPVLAAFWLLYQLRNSDTLFSLDHRAG